jgi:hypothetical protein
MEFLLNQLTPDAGLVDDTALACVALTRLYQNLSGLG